MATTNELHTLRRKWLYLVRAFVRNDLRAAYDPMRREQILDALELTGRSLGADAILVIQRILSAARMTPVDPTPPVDIPAEPIHVVPTPVVSGGKAIPVGETTTLSDSLADMRERVTRSAKEKA